MGEKIAEPLVGEEEERQFARTLLHDLRALELMLERQNFAEGRRIGVEQEMFLIDDHGLPAPVAPAVLEAISDSAFTTELARFNLEANLPPLRLEAPFLGQLEKLLSGAVDRVDREANKVGAKVLLTGILPTLASSDLSLENMSPEPRYQLLNESALRLRGREFTIFIRGIDQFEITHDNVMVEAANTSLQLHYQVTPEEFARYYNLIQLISAPLLAAAANSPLFCGKRLWHETRVALFERSVDARSSIERERGLEPRVAFGEGWVKDSVLELFRDNATRYRIMLVQSSEEDALAAVERGEVPSLSSLCLHNGTIWRWNRPCYGVSTTTEPGSPPRRVPHLRIENRILPAGPTVLDEVANAAFYYGLIEGLADQAATVPERLDFSSAKKNFLAAARLGLEAPFSWLDRRTRNARSLLLHELIPTARAGLEKLGVSAADLERYLGTFEERVRKRRTAASWVLNAVAGEKHRNRRAMGQLTLRLRSFQERSEPVHRWKPSQKSEPASPRVLVSDIMTRDLFTVRPGDVLDLATAMMEWRRVRHIPVEDETGRLQGLISPLALLEAWRDRGQKDPVPVSAAMDPEPETVSPETPFLDALEQLLRSKHGCLLVTSNGGRVAGIVTEHDFLERSYEFLLAFKAKSS